MTTTIGSIRIGPMTRVEAEEIAGWHYEPPYDFHDFDADEQDLSELLDDEVRADRYVAALGPEGELVGFFEFRAQDDIVVVGLGLRPDLTGRGLGLSFLKAGLGFARERFSPDRFRLSVAEFNARAIKVYERAGFVATRRFVHETNGGPFSFVELEREA